MEKENLMNSLQKPFSVDEISFKITSTTSDKKRGLVAAYVTNSAIQKRLDDVFGPFGWTVSFRDWKNGNAQLCTISIYDGEKWINKEDGAPNTDFEPIKGGLSDSMKRAARMFGIGRYLASDTLFKNPWVNLDGKKIPENDLARLRNEYNQYLSGSKAASRPSPTTHTSAETTNQVSDLKPTQQVELKQKTPSTPTKKTAPSALLDVIKNLIKQTNSDINGLLTHYKVSAIEDLSIQQANNAIAILSSSLAIKN